MLPKFWMAARFFTITLDLAILTAPLARVTVVIMGRNSGVRPTASATAKSSDSRGFLCMTAETAKSASTRNSTVFKMKIPNL